MGTALIRMPALPSLSFWGLTLLALVEFGSLGGDGGGMSQKPAACHDGEVMLVILGTRVCLLVTSSWPLV